MVVFHGNPNGDFLTVTAFFRESSLEVPSPRAACSVCSQSCQNENRSCLKTKCWKEFNLFLLLRLQTKVTFLCCGQEFCMGTFWNPKYSLHYALRYSPLTRCLPYWLARAVLPLLQQTVQLEHTDPSLLSHSLLLQMFWTNIVQLFWLVPNKFEKVWNLLYVAVTLFVVANKTTILTLFSTLRCLWSTILLNCLYHSKCSGLLDLMLCNGIFRKCSHDYRII